MLGPRLLAGVSRLQGEETPMTATPANKRIMVCAACHRAICYHGEMFCDDAQGAATEILTVGELRKLRLEHPDNWNQRKLLAVYGDPNPFGFAT